MNQKAFVPNKKMMQNLTDKFFHCWSNTVCVEQFELVGKTYTLYDCWSARPYSLKSIFVGFMWNSVECLQPKLG